jgi:plastocyanin domain-containing protein
MASLVSHRSTERILKVSAIFVVIIGSVMINRGLVLTGAGYDIKTATAVVFDTLDHWLQRLDRKNEVEEGQQIIRMVVTRSGYRPDTFVLRQGVPVKWIIEGRELTSCNRRIVVPSLNLEFDLADGEQTIEFVPQQPGVIPWSCWMGMIPGSFIVEPTEAARPDEPPDSGLDR